MPKYPLLAVHTSQVFIFSLHSTKMSNQHRFILKLFLIYFVGIKYRFIFIDLFLIYEGNVDQYESVHHPLSTLLVGIGNTLAVFKTNK